MNKLNIVAELGINHNGDLSTAFQMIDAAKEAGFDYVKFQKRTPDLCVPEEQKNVEKRVPWREELTTYLQYKKDVEFFPEEYLSIDLKCKKTGIPWFASVWDVQAVQDLIEFNLPIVKIPSAMLTNSDLIAVCKEKLRNSKLMISTGMSTEHEILRSILYYGPDILMHTNAVYPTPIDETNLGYIRNLYDITSNAVEIGYSNHCNSLSSIYASLFIQQTKDSSIIPIDWLELHMTLDPMEWGSDQTSSFEFKKVKTHIPYWREIHDHAEEMMKGYRKRELYPGEDKKRKVLRGY